MRRVTIPPPVVFLLCGLLAAWMADFKFQWHISTVLAATVLCGIGAYIAIAALLLFKKVETTIHPHLAAHTSELVVEGVYAFTRNPMYLSMLCVLIAGCLLFVSPWGWISVGVYVGYLTRFQIIHEEEVLLEKFGERYERYVNRVRRWI